MIHLRGAGWGPGDIGDLTGKTAIVTGANSGIGLEAAAELAAHGAHVVLACRDLVSAGRAADRLAGATPPASVEVLPLDLSSQASVRRSAARFAAEHGRLDVLVNNAGVMASPYFETEDGFELQFATNHLGPFAFTGLLLDLLLTTPGSRVVTVSSVLHRIGRLDFTNLQGLDGGFNRWFAYGNSKLANLAFTYELDRRLQQAGARTMALAVHPGWTRTNLVSNGPVLGASALRARAGRLAAHLGQSAAAGALPTLYAATAADVVGGEYFGPGGLAEQYGPPVRVRSNRRSRRPDDAARLWEVSQDLTGVYFDFGPGAHDDHRGRGSHPVHTSGPGTDRP
jgi:NAD(P)-dependent dehydrogenase (short-subunit alcohol dehydrogenase family)